MGMGKWLGTGAAVLAVVAMATPAEAQRHRGRHHHRGDRVDGGDVLLGALLAGGLIALTSSANRRERERREAREAEERAAAEASYEERYVPSEPNAQPTGYADVTDADGAADACAAAAESNGLRFARIARIGSIASIDPSGPNWFVRGTIELRNDYRARWDSRGFQCNIAGAGAPTVRIDGYAN
jgi:hypothetical protein